MLDDLMVETRFYRAMHELAILAWQKGLTVEALMTMADLVDSLIDEGTVSRVE
nr:hypothetical protein [Micromonospora sp. DSM 115978]